MSEDLSQLLNDMAVTGDSQDDDSDTVLEELQRAVEDQRRILARQGELIRRLRKELKEVRPR